MYIHERLNIRLYCEGYGCFFESPSIMFVVVEQPHQLMDSLLKYKKYSILNILTPKPPTSVFVKMSKYL